MTLRAACVFEVQMTLSLYFAWVTLVCTYECIHEVGHDTLCIV